MANLETSRQRVLATQNPPRRCYACSGDGHLSRNCSSPSRKQLDQHQKSKQQSTNAVSAAITSEPQLFSETVIDEVLVRYFLVDTNSAFSIMSSAFHDRLPSRLALDAFKNSHPDIVGVGGVSFKVKGYINVYLKIVEIEVTHPLLVVIKLLFALLIGMDVLQPHTA